MESARNAEADHSSCPLSGLGLTSRLPSWLSTLAGRTVLSATASELTAEDDRTRKRTEVDGSYRKNGLEAGKHWSGFSNFCHPLPLTTKYCRCYWLAPALLCCVLPCSAALFHQIQRDVTRNDARRERLRARRRILGRLQSQLPQTYRALR